MKKLTIIFFVLIASIGFSQDNYKIYGDSIIMKSFGGASELIIMNSTMSDSGAVAINIGGGLLSYRYIALTALDSGCFTIGGSEDTICPSPPQQLSISNDTIFLTDGGFIVIPAAAFQDLSYTQPDLDSVTVMISGGQPTTFPIKDQDPDPLNEIQLLTMSPTQDTIFLSIGGSFVVLPSAAAPQNLSYSVPNPDSVTVNIDGGGLGTTIPVKDQDSNPLNEIQVLSLAPTQDTLFLSSGNFVILPSGSGAIQNLNSNQPHPDSITVTISDGGDATTFSIKDLDGNSSNELQDLSTSEPHPDSVTVSISDGGTDVTFDIRDLDSDTLNEIQMMSISNDTIFLEGGGFVKLPPQLPSDSTWVTAEIRDTFILGVDSFIYQMDSNFVYHTGKVGFENGIAISSNADDLAFSALPPLSIFSIDLNLLKWNYISSAHPFASSPGVTMATIPAATNLVNAGFDQGVFGWWHPYGGLLQGLDIKHNILYPRQNQIDLNWTDGVSEAQNIRMDTTGFEILSNTGSSMNFRSVSAGLNKGVAINNELFNLKFFSGGGFTNDDFGALFLDTVSSSLFSRFNMTATGDYYENLLDMDSLKVVLGYGRQVIAHAPGGFQSQITFDTLGIRIELLNSDDTTNIMDVIKVSGTALYLYTDSSSTAPEGSVLTLVDDGTKRVDLVPIPTRGDSININKLVLAGVPDTIECGTAYTDNFYTNTSGSIDTVYLSDCSYDAEVSVINRTSSTDNIEVIAVGGSIAGGTVVLSPGNSLTAIKPRFETVWEIK